MNAINEAAMAIMISLMTQFGADNRIKIDQQEIGRASCRERV